MLLRLAIVDLCSSLPDENYSCQISQYSIKNARCYLYNFVEFPLELIRCRVRCSIGVMLHFGTLASCNAEKQTLLVCGGKRTPKSKVGDF